MIRAGFIGCGAIAVEHLIALTEVDGIEPAAYYDVDMTRAHDAQLRFGGEVVETVDALLERSDVDVVYICTHHDSHRELALRACRAGKNIMMEKPMALTLEACDDIVNAVQQAGVVMMTAFKLRYYPLVDRVRDFIAKPVVATAHIMDNRWPDDYWAQDPVRGGGNVQSQGVHGMDLLCHLFDDVPATIYAEGGRLTHDTGDVVDTIVTTIRFTRGGVASLTVSDAGWTPYSSKFSFQLADGHRTAHLHNRLRSAHLFDGRETSMWEDERELGMIRENEELVRALQSGRAPMTTELEGRQATSMVLAAIESVRTGRPQHLTPHLNP